MESRTISSVDTLIPTPPVSSGNIGNGGISVYGEKPPGSSAEVHNISISAYNYQVEKVGAQVYTSKLIKGKASMKITVENWKRLPGGGTGTNNELTLTVYKSDGTKVKSKTITISNKKGSHTFTGLNSSTKYYVKFSVPQNTNTYSFNGSIS